MSQCGHGGDGGALLSTTGRGGGDEETGILAPVGALLPLSTGLVPKCFDLCGEVSIARGDAEQYTIERFELGRVVEDRDVGGLRWCIHLGQDLV